MIIADSFLTLSRVESGIPGKSAYEHAVEAGYKGTLEEFNKKISDIGNSVTKDELYSLHINIDKAIKDSNDSLQEEIDENQKKINNIENYTNKLKNFINIDNSEKIRIGKEDSSIYSIQDNDSYEFKNKETGETLLSLSATEGAVLSTVKIKNKIEYAHWQIIETADECLDDIYIM